mmetsp:Transcript_26101/g.77828  ORF Transcript_26101/g.77828 Transcript_26101/m.77828 type:complete len:219 (+) Transcript_26101:257-913(+)
MSSPPATCCSGSRVSAESRSCSSRSKPSSAAGRKTLSEVRSLADALPIVNDCCSRGLARPISRSHSFSLRKSRTKKESGRRESVCILHDVPSGSRSVRTCPTSTPSHRKLAGAGAAALPSLSLGGLAGGLRAAFDGFTPAVWGVILLKALNGLLIPATFKYADNILYSYAKPSSIVVTTLVSAAFAGVVPAPSLLIGVALVVSSVVLYSSKPKAGKAD